MFLDFMIKGGAFMWPILLTAILGLVIVVDRLIRVVMVYSLDGEQLMRQIQKHVMGENIDRAISVCDANPNAALSQVLKAGLAKSNYSEMDIQHAIEERTLDFIPRVTARIQYLPTIANAATLLGLLGTVIGLIQAFSAVADADPVQRQTALTQGVEIAMYTTAFGLIVAIPLIGFHAFLNSKANLIIDDLDRYSVRLMNLLSARSRGLVSQKGQ